MPTEQPYKVFDRRRLNGYGVDPTFSEPVRTRHSGQRRYFHDYGKDAPALLGGESRRVLMTVGRYLYSNSSIVRGALNEMASLATSSFIPQFDGEDKSWGQAAEDWLYNHDRVCDVRGGPYDMASLNRLVVLSVLRDGDCFVLLTESEGGWPMFQIIPAHRVGSRNGDGVIDSGPWAGRSMVDGAVVNEYGRAVAYNVLGEDASLDRVIDTSSLIPVYFPEYADQVRGVSSLASSVIDFQDVLESRRLELVAQKLAAALTMVETNETGMADDASALVSSVATTDTPADITYSEEHFGGTVRYFRSGTGGAITPVVSDRPTQNQREFADSIIRQALHGIGWSFDFSVDPTKVGGQSGRVVVEKINRKLEQIREVLLSPVRRKMDGYRLSKAIKLGEVPSSDEWYKWTYQGPAKITSDEKYSSDVALQEFRSGFTTMESVCAQRGAWWQDVVEQRAREAAYISQKAAEAGVPVDMVQMLTPNGTQSGQEVQDDYEDTQDQTE